MIGRVPFEFILFACVLAGVVVFDRHTLRVALNGALVIAAYKIVFSPFAAGPGLAGFAGHLAREGATLTNLLLLLLGFAVLARTFDDSGAPLLLPRWLPDDWKGGFALLGAVLVLSAFLDNIAAAMIGATVARTVFRNKLHVGYLAAIVAASNAGGAGSVVGDTTTTMMWIAGVPPLEVAVAFIGSAAAFVCFGVLASRRQQSYSPIVVDAPAGARVDVPRIVIVVSVLAAAIAVNVVVNTRFGGLAAEWPLLGLSVWVVIVASAVWRMPAWSVLPSALRGAVFLLALVLCASMMPVDQLPAPSWQATFGLGVLSSVFDNIPLTALAIRQGGHDWGLLAYAVGFGGSMIWFGSSAGVAVATMFPEARSVRRWLREGWPVALAFVVGFFVLVAFAGFHPGTPLRVTLAPASVSVL